MNFDVLFHFESDLSRYTNAPYVIVTDGCTHAIELVLRYYQIKKCEITAYTYISIPQMLRQLNVKFNYREEKWSGEYQLHGTNIWDSARRFEPGMYRSGQIQCLSFGHSKPMELGKCGAILLDDKDAYHQISQMRSDGRNLHITPWQDQKFFGQGYHYCPTLETCRQGRESLINVVPQRQTVNYPDCREIKF